MEKAAAERAKAEALKPRRKPTNLVWQPKTLAWLPRKLARTPNRLAPPPSRSNSCWPATWIKPKLAAADADRMRMKAEQDQAALRQQLLDQFNSILQTRDTARGLIVNMSDVLFDTARYTLKPGAREKLAKVSGIILGTPA